MEEEPTPVSKRLLDVGLSSAGLVLSAPLWALIALAVKLEDGGSVFYGQERVGKGGQPFTSWKFRTMREEGPEAGEDAGPERQAGRNDPRITRVGRILRATAMDELPQLWSIFRGHMSFVGPRAMLPEEESVREGTVTRLVDVDGFEKRHSVLPGLTGVAQVYAPRDLPPRQKFRYDLLYVENRSLGLDLRLILLSFWISFRGAWPEVGREEGADGRASQSVSGGLGLRKETSWTSGD